MCGFLAIKHCNGAEMETLFKGYVVAYVRYEITIIWKVWVFTTKLNEANDSLTVPRGLEAIYEFAKF